MLFFRSNVVRLAWQKNSVFGYAELLLHSFAMNLPYYTLAILLVVTEGRMNVRLVMNSSLQ